MAVDPVDDWAKAKEEYFALTHVKKPREKVLKFFATSHTGLSGAIKKIADYANLKPKDKSAAKFGKLIDDFRKDSKEYIKLLTSLIDEEDNKTVVQYTFSGGKTDIKTIKTDMYRGLKMLKAKLENYDASYDVQLGMLVHIEAGTPKIEKLEAQYETLLKNGFKRFTAAAQAIKTTPTVDVWNREMGDQDGVRSLTTALGVYRAIKKELDKDQIALSQEQTQKLQLTMHWIQQLSPWADGNRRVLGANDDVLAELKLVSAQVKACSAAVN